MSTEESSAPMEDVLEHFQLTTNVDEYDSSLNAETNSIQHETQSSIPSETDTIQTSDVWNHFKRQKIDGKWKAICNYCDSKLLGDAKQGTSRLRSHLGACKLQTTSGMIVVDSSAFDLEAARRALSKMIILHEYPISIVDHVGFKEFCVDMNPLFKGISRNTIRSDIMKLYKNEKESTMKLLSKNQSRVAITTDMWTASHQNRGYMAVTTHFIDDSWTLQSRLVRFIYVPVPHTDEILADVLLECLMDWNLDSKLSTLTADNYFTNDAMIERILDKISPRSLILGGQLFHMRCCAQILNLIVKDSLSIISDAIEKIIESVSFWTATPEREEKFIGTCGQVNIPYGKKLILDCKNRWDSTFLMLQVAIQYKDVFDRLAQREHQYKTLPSENDWMMAKEICQKLELFYDVTQMFSGTSYPIANVYFPKVCVIKLALTEWLGCPNLVIHQMAASMITKFDKYWSVINRVMAVGVVLDPRYKVLLLEFFFPQIYGEEADNEIDKVKSICQDILREYDTKIKGKEKVTSCSSPNQNVVSVGDVGRKEGWRSYDAKRLSAIKNATSNKSELDQYLEEPVLLDPNDEFDILGWWKVCGLQYPILQMIARDFLAIPISTVASKYSFSTGGRFITPHRSRLRPDTLEALMCVQDWLWADVKGSLESKIDNIEWNTILEDMDADIE